MTGKATVVNYGNQRIAGSLSWELPKGWTAADTEFALEPGEAKAVPVKLQVPASAAKDQRYDLTLRGKGGDGKATLPHWVTVGEPLWIRLFRASDSHVVATVFNRSDKAQSGQLSFSGEGGVQVGEPSLPFAVGPWGRDEVRLPISGMEPLRSPARVKTEARVGQQVVARRSLMLYPPIPNGGFEQDTVGDGLPDWWFARDERDSVQCYQLGKIDKTNPYQGKNCLRLDANPEKDGKFLKSEPMVRFLDKGRYRIRCAIRKTAPGDDVIVQVADQQLTTDKAGEWAVVEKEWTFDGNFRAFNVQVINRSRNPAWFDELTIERVK
jgi:hypothetical protein